LKVKITNLFKRLLRPKFDLIKNIINNPSVKGENQSTPMHEYTLRA